MAAEFGVPVDEYLSENADLMDVILETIIKRGVVSLKGTDSSGTYLKDRFARRLTAIKRRYV
jgi:hypothetical protein